MSTAILDQDSGVGAQRRIGVKHGAGQPSVELCVSLGGVDLLQNYLAVCPGQIEYTLGDTPILIFLDKSQAGIARLGDAGYDIDSCRFARIECYPVTDGHNRIEHRTRTAGERVGSSHRLRIGYAVSAADETHAIGLVRNAANVGSMDGHQVKHPRHLLVGGLGPASTEDGVSGVDDLCLNKKIAECRMQGVGGR